MEKHEKKVLYQPTTNRSFAESRLLTEFRGIGKRSAETLCQEYDTVYELVNGRELADRVAEVVPTQYHDRLWAELRSFADWRVEDDRVSSVSRPDPDRYIEDGCRIDEEDIPPVTVAEMTQNNELNEISDAFTID